MSEPSLLKSLFNRLEFLIHFSRAFISNAMESEELRNIVEIIITKNITVLFFQSFLKAKKIILKKISKNIPNSN